MINMLGHSKVDGTLDARKDTEGSLGCDMAPMPYKVLGQDLRAFPANEAYRIGNGHILLISCVL